MFSFRRLLIPLCLAFFPAFVLANQDRPNILWLSAEDISPHLGCYGDPHAITPHLDALASAGARYTRAFATAGVCAPSRSAIITGMYQNSIGTHNMRCKATLPDWLKPFPLYLREAGYYCTNQRKTDYQFDQPSPREIWDEVSATAHWKNRPPGQPFFAVFNFTGCHESGIADPEKYEEVTKELSPGQRQDAAALTTLPPYYPDTPVVREDWKRNYELITAMDAWAGRLIDELKDSGEWENTVVMFWSDHGVGLPRAKRWLYDSGTRIPLIVRFPESLVGFAPQAPGGVEGRLVSAVDFAPTMLTLAGVEVPGHLQGMPFVGDQLRTYVYGARDRMDERHDLIRTVRNERYRYIRNFEPLKPYDQFINTAENGATMKEIRKAQAAGTLTGPAAVFVSPDKPVEELYDLENDPHETRNLATDPGQAGRLEEMREALLTWQTDIGDLGLVPESEIERSRETAGSDFAILRQDASLESRLQPLLSAAVRASDGPKQVPGMLADLASDEAAVRYWGAQGIGNFPGGANDHAGAKTALRQALGDPSPAVSIAAARALCLMGGAQGGLGALEKQLSSANPWTKLEAALVLDELDETARPLLPLMKAELAKEQANRYITRVLNKAVNDLEGTSNQVP